MGVNQISMCSSESGKYHILNFDELLCYELGEHFLLCFAAGLAAKLADAGGALTNINTPAHSALVNLHF